MKILEQAQLKKVIACIIKEKIKIEKIRKRLEEYHKHKNDPYAYFEGEIEAVKELMHHAPEDIEFLLDIVKDLEARLRGSLRFPFPTTRK